MSTFGVPVTVDTLLNEVKIEEYDALAVPEVAFSLLSILVGEEKMSEVRTAMGY